jgi:hypothetical protein
MRREKGLLVFRNPITRKFTPGKIFTVDEDHPRLWFQKLLKRWNHIRCRRDLDGRLSQYGLVYFFTDDHIPNERGEFTFKRT